MTQVTVAMPVRNAAAFIGQAIESIRQQTDIDWELIVIDDASSDDTVKIVRSFQDTRIQLETNETRRGIGYGHNRVLALSRAPFIAHIDADDFIARGALRKMVTALENNPRAGQAYCQFYDIDQTGSILQDIFLHRTKVYQKRAASPFDYRRELIATGMVCNHLRTYPRHVLKTLGGFNADLTFAVDYEMALRIVNQHEIEFVPEFLYARRLHTHNTTESMRFKNFRIFVRRYQICRALQRSHQVIYFNQTRYSLNRLLLSALLETIGLQKIYAQAHEKIIQLPRHAKFALRDRVVVPALEWLYAFAVNHAPHWQLTPARRVRTDTSAPRVGYYKWQHPTLSETFIVREVEALRATGMTVEIFADEPDPTYPRPAHDSTHYLRPQNKKQLAQIKEFFARKNRLRYWQIYLYITLQRYGEYKTWREDRYVFEHALQLADALKQHNITRLHTPWADRRAFIALLAAALLDIPYSVEARAFDLHREKSQYGLRERLANAKWVATNSDYNAHAITRLTGPTHPPIHVIRELFPLEQFPPRPAERAPGAFRIVSVARLVQEKGLDDLLRAAAELRARGISFQCEIIGAPAEPAYTVYRIQLLRLYHQLELQDCVTFSGAQPFPYILESYRHADLFVLPCVIADNGGRDISPNSLIEAMAMRLPVISTQLSAIPEIIEPDVSGILVAPNNPHALANAIDELMRDPQRRARLGKQARARVEERYDASKNVQAFVELFRAS